MKRNIDVSIVIVSYNTSKLLDECISSIISETNINYEIIVIDNNSKDNTKSMIKEKYPDIHLIENHRNDGFAKANNQGFKISSGKYIFMLNPDTVVLENVIDKIVQFMDGHPEAGACGPKNIGYDGTLQHNCHHFPTLLIKLVEYLQLKRLYPGHKYFGRENMTYWDYNEIREVDWITGCSLLIRREALDQVGLLDENYFMYAEEIDLCYRLKGKGWKTLYYPYASIVHYCGQSALSQDKETVFSKSITSYLFLTRYYYFKKHYGNVSCISMKILDILYYLIVILKNIFRKNTEVRKSKIEEAMTVISLSFKKK